jgi:hypothetical protein
MAPPAGTGDAAESLRRASGFEFGVSCAAGRLRTVMVHRLELSLPRLT